MSNPKVVLCDDKGQVTGEFLDREVAHTGKGSRHLAITILIKNNQGEVLLQKRKHRRFNDIWDFTGATDLWKKEDNTFETFDEATLRCLKREYGIVNISLKNLGFFNYFAIYKGQCENEHCAMMVANYDGPINLNPEVGYGYKWMDEAKFYNDIKQNPQNYSPWAVKSIKILRNNGFFNINKDKIS